MSYESGKRRYLSFCRQFNLTPLPVDERTLCRFVAFLFSSSLSYQSVRSYLSAVRHLQIVNGWPDPALTSFPRLDYALRGVRREAPRSERHQRLPITPELLRKIYQVWAKKPRDFDRIMLWAAFCLGFFGFMRAGEFTCPSMKTYNPDMLSPADVAVDSHSAPTCITVHLSRSKTDPFGAGMTLYLGRTGDILCPVTSVLAYLAARPSSPGPLFIFSDGSPLSRPRLVRSLRQALRDSGVDDSHFSGHSFRIGAATTASRAGLSDSLIKMLGRWESSAFTLYVRTPRQTLTTVSRALVTNSP